MPLLGPSEKQLANSEFRIKVEEMHSWIRENELPVHENLVQQTKRQFETLQTEHITESIRRTGKTKEYDASPWVDAPTDKKNDKFQLRLCRDAVSNRVVIEGKYVIVRGGEQSEFIDPIAYIGIYAQFKHPKESNFGLGSSDAVALAGGEKFIYNTPYALQSGGGDWGDLVETLDFIVANTPKKPDEAKTTRTFEDFDIT